MNKWEKSFEAYSKMRTEILADVINLTEEEFHQKPKDGGWSAQQLFQHLIDIEQATIHMIEKSTTSEKSKSVGFKKKIYSFILNRYLKSRKKFQIPSVLSQPANDISKEEIIEKWNTIHLKSQVVISKFDSTKKNLGVFKHPKTGWLNISQSMSFMKFHQQHHLPQLKAILLEVNS